MRPLLNRWRRWLWRQLFYRMVFGEQGRAGQALPHTRIAPSTCIEGEAGLELADHVFIGQFNFLDATAGLRIAEGVQITNFVSIVTHSSHRSIRLLGRAYASRARASPAPSAGCGGCWRRPAGTGGGACQRGSCGVRGSSPAQAA